MPMESYIGTNDNKTKHLHAKRNNFL